MHHQKVTIITGGGSGLGLAMAQKFAFEGYFIVIIGRSEEKLRKACETIGQNAAYEVCDLANLKELPSLVEKIIEKYGPIHCLVNNAGVHLKKPLLEVTDSEYQHIILTNQISVFSLIREVAKHMVKENKGVILNISSMASQYGIPNVIAYTASKSAIEGMTRAMAVELSPLGIRVNCIAPGFIKTDMSAKALDSDPERKAKVISRTPLNVLGLPEDIADAAFFLCSENAKFITGMVLPVDGGNSIGF